MLGKKLLKGDEKIEQKEGKIHIFSPIGNIFSPIDLKYKIAKKGQKGIFRLVRARTHPLKYNKFHLGKKYKSGKGGGGKKFQI